MRFLSWLFAALGSAVLLSAAAPAFAQRDDHRHDWHGPPARHDWHHDDRGYYAPPVVVGPPAYGYYAPPPVAYGPGVSIGINIP